MSPTESDWLPDGLRALFDLLWYQGMSQAEAAALLGVAVPLERLKSVPKFAARHHAEPTRRRAGTPAKKARRPARAVRERPLAMAIFVTGEESWPKPTSTLT
jgi:hypothetical protein